MNSAEYYCGVPIGLPFLALAAEGAKAGISAGVSAGFNAIGDEIHKAATGYYPGESVAIVNDAMNALNAFAAQIDAELAQVQRDKAAQAAAAAKAKPVWSPHANLKMQYGTIKAPAPSSEPEARATVPRDEGKPFPTWAKWAAGLAAVGAVGGGAYVALRKKRR